MRMPTVRAILLQSVFVGTMCLGQDGNICRAVVPLIDTVVVNFYGLSAAQGVNYHYLEEIYTGNVDSILFIGNRPIIIDRTYTFHADEVHGWFGETFRLGKEMGLGDTARSIGCRPYFSDIAKELSDLDGYDLKGSEPVLIQISDVLVFGDIGVGYIVLKYGKPRGWGVMYAGLYSKIGEKWSLVKWEKASM